MIRILIRIQEVQKHVDPVDPDPEHCFNQLLNDDGYGIYHVVDPDPVWVLYFCRIRICIKFILNYDTDEKRRKIKQWKALLWKKKISLIF